MVVHMRYLHQRRIITVCRAFIACLVTLSTTQGLVAGESGAGPSLLARLRPGHPRLILLDDELPARRKAIRDDAALAALYRKTRESALALLGVPPIDYQYDRRNHMLESCRQAVDRIYRLALVYRLDGDKRLARRAIDELMVASRLPGWDPAHFLDTAELTHAVAIGYDWLYSELTPDERRTIRGAICRLGLNEGLYFYGSSLPIAARYHDYNWAVCNFNWNLVCNGGMAVGALAVADDEPEIAARVLSAAIRSVPLALVEYGPDGGWAEGPGYWRYASDYAAYFLAALRTALGEAAVEPFLKTPGLSRAGEFLIHLTGPLDRPFNFADASDHAPRAWQMFWMARQFNRPEYAWYAARHASGSAQDVIWYDPRQVSPRQAGLPTDAWFRHVEIACLRSAWEDPNAVFVSFKGGDSSANHGHLDMGSFVLDADGVRWAIDLGPDNYALARYFVTGKNDYYRLKTEGHNTLLINGENQRTIGRSPIVAFRAGSGTAYAVVDLSEAYGRPRGQVFRGIARLAGRAVVVQDEVSLTRASQITWQMHTRAEVVLHGRDADLREGGRHLRASIVEPAGAVFALSGANPPAPQAQQPDVRKLVVRLDSPAGNARLVVLFRVGGQGETPAIRPLAEWIKEGRTTNRP
jgi:hypothetical protein